MTPDPRACPSCGLWQRTEAAAQQCPDVAHDGQRQGLSALDDPARGHTFELAARVRGSSSVVGVPGHRDANWWGEVGTIRVRAWSLREAVQAVSALPLSAWTTPDDDAEPQRALDGEA